MTQQIIYRVGLTGTNQAIAEAEKLKRALSSTVNTQVARAAATAQIESERRITAAARAEAAARSAASRAETAERIQTARAAAAQVIEQEKRVTAERMAEIRRQQDAASRASSGGGFGSGALSVGGAIAGYLGVQTVQGLVQQATALGDLQVRADRAGKAFDILSGGADQARARLDAIKAAAGGAVTELQAIEIGTQATALGLAKTSEEFGRLTTAARAIAFISPTIKDMGSAMTELALFASNAPSFARADQLGLSVSEVKERMRELREEFPQLDDSQIKLQASVEILNQKYGALLSTAEASASGLEKLRVAMADVRAEIAQGPIGEGVNDFAGGAATALRRITGTLTPQDRFAEIFSSVEAKRSAMGAGFTGIGVSQEDAARTAAFMDQMSDALQRNLAAIQSGKEGAEEYQVQLIALAQAVLTANQATEEQLQALSDLNSEWKSFSIDAASAEDFSSNLSASAERAIEAVRQQREFFQALRDTELLTARAAEFDGMGIPGMGQMIQDMNALGIEIARTGQVTEEQTQALAMADQQMDELASAVKFLSDAENAASVESGKFDASLATTAGYAEALILTFIRLRSAIAEAMAIEGSVTSSMVGGLSGLINRGLLTAQQAEQIYNQQQMQARSGAHAIATSGGTDVQKQLAQAELQYQLNEPLRVIEETERVRRENERKAAAEAERAMRAAAKGTEKAFKDVAKNLESDLRSIPGLFGVSDVTEADMAAAERGEYQDKADEWLRRLRDEVQNGKDYEGVSIDQAREALSKVGIQAVESAEGVLAQIEEAWSSGVLFADKSNLALLNEEAVRMQLDLKEKARLGQQNILEHFGVVVDEAVAAVTGGGGGAAPIEVPEIPTPEVPEMNAEYWQNLIRQLPQGPDPSSAALTGGAMTLDTVTLDPGLTSTLASDLTAQLAEQMDRFKAQGSLIALYQSQGYTGYERADHAQDYARDIGAQIVESEQYFKNLGSSVAAYQEIGYMEHIRGDHAQDYFMDIGYQFQASLEMFKGQGGGIAYLHEAGYKEYVWGDVAGSVLTALDAAFFTEENKKVIKGTGHTMAAELASALSGYDYVPVAKAVITAFGNSLAVKDNIELIWTMAGGLADILREGVVLKMDQPGWGQQIATALTSSVLAALNDSLTS